jgi:hypothetical protein
MGERVPTTKVQEAAKALGIARRTLERARKNLKVRAEQGQGHWSLWISPKDHPKNKARRTKQ